MTVKEIELEKKINDELGLYEIVELNYNEATKDLYILVIIDFEKEIVKEHNPQFIKKMEDVTSFDLECFDNVPLEKFSGFFLEIRNKKGIFSVIPNYIPISEIETYTFASLEKLFKTILKDWKFI